MCGVRDRRLQSACSQQRLGGRKDKGLHAGGPRSHTVSNASFTLSPKPASPVIVCERDGRWKTEGGDSVLPHCEGQPFFSF